jgi:hypothetical protein
LVIAGTNAETVGQSHAIYDAACEPKELFLIDGGMHFDFYDQPRYVGTAVAQIEVFFNKHL